MLQKCRFQKLLSSLSSVQSVGKANCRLLQCWIWLFYFPANMCRRRGKTLIRKVQGGWKEWNKLMECLFQQVMYLILESHWRGKLSSARKKSTNEKRKFIVQYLIDTELFKGGWRRWNLKKLVKSRHLRKLRCSCFPLSYLVLKIVDFEHCG